VRGSRWRLAGELAAGDKKAMRPLLLAAVAVFAACSPARYFAPRENQNGTGPDGHPAAVYPLAGVPSAGEVRLWSGGAVGVDVDGEDLVEVHLGFELENTGGEPIAVDPTALQCDDVWVDGLQLAAVPPARIEGATEAAPGRSAVFDVWFQIDAARPGDLDGFSVRFRVVAGGRELLAQATPFVPYRPYRVWRDDSYWWYGGYWGRPYFWWGPGFGYGWYGPYCH
jgi:hypothetical protein